MASYLGADAAAVHGAEQKEAFARQHPNYGYMGWLEANYQAELGCRFHGQHYLDWTGGGCTASIN